MCWCFITSSICCASDTPWPSVCRNFTAFQCHLASFCVMTWYDIHRATCSWQVSGKSAGWTPYHVHQKLIVPRTHNKLGDRSFATAGPRLWNVEWPSIKASAAGTLLWFFQTISENMSFWQLKCLVTLSTYRGHTNIFIYLSTCTPVEFPVEPTNDVPIGVRKTDKMTEIPQFL